MTQDLTALVPPVPELKKVGPIFDTATYLRTGQHSFENLKKFAYLKPSNSVLDVGCGLGRVAIHLTEFLQPSANYLGIDIVKPSIDWCQGSITPKFTNFEFAHLNVYNKMYNPGGVHLNESFSFPAEPSEQFDIAILFSVFTHMLPGDVAVYLREIARSLKRGGILFASFFLINADSTARMEQGTAQFKFKPQAGGYFAHNEEVHEGAVAYLDETVLEMMLAAGFQRDKLIYGNWAGRLPAESGQDLVICSKH